MLDYKGYEGEANWSEEDNCHVGHIIGITDLVTFEAGQVEDIKQSFKDAVDDYIKTINKLGKPIISNETNKKQIYSRTEVKDLLIKFAEEIHAEYSCTPRVTKFIRENLN